MEQTSDSESGYSDKGVRYKTDSIRNENGSSFSASNKSEDMCFGPALPHHLTVGPTLPPNLHQTNLEIKYKPEILGPQIPPYSVSNFENGRSSENERLSATSSQIIGPSLPSHLQETKSPIGPKLPAYLQTTIVKNKSDDMGVPNHIDTVIPEQVSHVAESQSDEEVYGPVPVGFSHSRGHIELEERALQMKIDMLNQETENKPSREEWMLELPASKAKQFGLGPRQFRAKEAPDLSDRSLWTDTPEDRTKKKKNKQVAPLDLKRDAELQEIKKRNSVQEIISKKSKRPKDSLVDIHMEKIKKKKDQSGTSERRPFSRDIDLQINRFDEAQKKAVLKKAQLLDTRFSVGESKFL